MHQVHESLASTSPARPVPTSESVASTAPAPPCARWNARIDGGLGACLATAWVVAYCTAGMLEPVPQDPAVMRAWYVTVINVALLGSLVVMAAGLIARRRIGIFASAAMTVVFATAVVACPLTGHHSFGVWWFGQLLCVAGVAAATGAALHRTRA